MPGIYKIGVVSQKTGLSAATLRLWEDQYGLLAPVRTVGGTRLYSESDVERVLYVRHLVRERGYALGAIAAIIDNAAASLPNAMDRIALENIYLRDATNHADLEEGRRIAMVHATLRSLSRAKSAEQAAIILVAGVKALTGAHSAGLGLFRQNDYMLVPLVTASGDSILRSPGSPLSISDFPREWQRAIDTHEPYADHDLLRLELPVEVNSQMSQYRARSFHAEPLVIANDMVGVLTIASSRAGGIGNEAERVCGELAAAAGAAVHYFAQHLEAAPPGPRL
jgi:DNA-binding transcriptional MerR regulator